MLLVKSDEVFLYLYNDGFITLNGNVVANAFGFDNDDVVFDVVIYAFVVDVEVYDFVEYMLLWVNFGFRC
jgi:hypothetical protein